MRPKDVAHKACRNIFVVCSEEMKELLRVK